jgi:hypothetical protein
MVIVLVLAEVSGQQIDPLGKQGNLNLWRTSIGSMHPKARDDVLFLRLLQRHIGEASLIVYPI